MSRHDPRLILLQMRDYTGVTRSCALSKAKDLSGDDIFRLAIERALELVGETAKDYRRN